MDRFFALPPLSLMDPENQNFQKIKKALEDIIILQMFTINNSHIIYGFSDMEWNRQIFLSFWTIFALLPKNQNFEKLKKTCRYHFTKAYQKS